MPVARIYDLGKSLQKPCPGWTQLTEYSLFACPGLIFLTIKAEHGYSTNLAQTVAATSPGVPISLLVQFDEPNPAHGVKPG